MSKRKLTATNLEQGKNRNNLSWKGKHFCPECKAYRRPHSEGCDGKWANISMTAQLPKKSASRAIWEKFKRKFVDREFAKKAFEEEQDRSEWGKRQSFIRRVLKK